MMQGLTAAYHQRVWLPAGVIRPIEGGLVLLDLADRTRRLRVVLVADQVRFR